MGESSMIVPFFSPWHAPFVQAALDGCGVNASLVADTDDNIVHLGLASVNNDACYSAIIAAGQALSVLESSPDNDRVSDENASSAGEAGMVLSILSPCVHCRSDDLPYLVGRALGGSASGVLDVKETIERLPRYAQERIAAALVGGDVLLQTKLHVGARADDEGKKRLEEMVNRERQLAVAALSSGGSFDVELFARNVHRGAEAAMSFSDPVPAIGVVGSPSLVFNPTMNGELVNCIQNEGCEAVLPYLSPSISYSLFQRGVSCAMAKALDELCASLADVSTRYPCETVGQLKDRARGFVPEDVVCGSGWMFAGQMLSLWDNGVRSILYASVFGCLAGHVSGQGVLKSIRCACPSINLVSVEYDPGTSAVNQKNRIKLLASVAKRSHLADGKRDLKTG